MSVATFIKKSTSGLSAVVLILSQSLAFSVGFFITNTTLAGAAETNYSVPTTAVSVGSGSWDETTPVNLHNSDSIYVSESGGSTQGFSGFNLPIPSSATIDGIEVFNEAFSSETAGCRMGVGVSVDGGLTFSSSSFFNLTDESQGFTYGGPENTLGLTVNSSDFDSNANFIVSLQDNDPGNNCENTATTFVDQMLVRVYYTEEIVNQENVIFRVEKTVINDDGGTLNADDFGISAVGFSDYSFGNPLSVEGMTSVYSTSATFAPLNRPIVLSEMDTPGYDEGEWSCSNGVNGENLTVEVTLNSGDDVTCSITNNDIPQEIEAPQLSVTKNVTNDDEGTLMASDFDLFVNGVLQEDARKGGGDELASSVTYLHSETTAGIEYTLSEEQIDGYSASAVTCFDNETEESLTHPIILANGQKANCSITNDDVSTETATIRVFKTVVNDNGGDASPEDFAFSLDNSLRSFASADNFVAVEVTPGTYSVEEVEGTNEYTATYEGCSDINAEAGQSYDCTVTNDDVAPRILVGKTTESCSDDMFDFTIENNEATESFVLQALCSSDGNEYELYSENDSYSDVLYSYVTGSEFQAGSVTITELDSEGWYTDSISCTDFSYDSIGLFSQGQSIEFEIGLGDDIFCDFYNSETSGIDVVKFHDINENGEFDEDEETLQNWEMISTEICDVYTLLTTVSTTDESDYSCDSNMQSAVTNSEGVAEFRNLKEGLYEVSETLQDGWVQSVLYCDVKRMGPIDVFSLTETMDESPYEQNNNSFYLRSGRTVTCFVGNHREPAIEIEKSNNAITSVAPGTEIEFTLNVTVPEDSGNVYGDDSESVYVPVQVTDNLQDEFTYVEESFTAISSVRGDLKTAGITSDPGYASPGTWALTNSTSNVVMPGEVITLSYRATVDSDTDAGSYPTVAQVIGYNVDASAVVDADADDVVVVQIPTVLGATTTTRVTSVPKLAETGSSSTLYSLLTMMLIVSSVAGLYTKKSIVVSSK